MEPAILTAKRRLSSPSESMSNNEAFDTPPSPPSMTPSSPSSAARSVGDPREFGDSRLIEEDAVIAHQISKQLLARAVRRVQKLSRQSVPAGRVEKAAGPVLERHWAGRAGNDLAVDHQRFQIRMRDRDIHIGAPRHHAEGRIVVRRIGQQNRPVRSGQARHPVSGEIQFGNGAALFRINRLRRRKLQSARRSCPLLRAEPARHCPYATVFP